VENNVGYNDEEKEVLEVLAVVQCTWPPLLLVEGEEGSSLKCRAAQQHNMRSCRHYCRIPVAIPLVGTQWVRLFILDSAGLVPSHFFFFSRAVQCSLEDLDTFEPFSPWSNVQLNS
jgi:hypothetical protein